MEIIELLGEIGVPRKEASVYLALVKSGGMSASEVAAYTGMHRPNIYDILKKLESRGLASSFTLNNKTFYRARGVEGLRDFLEEKMEYLGEISKELEKYKEAEKECEVSVFSGKRALRAMQADVFETLKKEGGKRESFVMGVDEGKFMEVDRVSMTQFFEKIKKAGYRERVIVREGETYLPAPKETTKYAALPTRYFDSTTSFTVTGDIVSVVIFSEPTYYIRIKSKRVADAYRKKFELMWKVAKKVRR